MWKAPQVLQHCSCASLLLSSSCKRGPSRCRSLTAELLKKATACPAHQETQLSDKPHLQDFCTLVLSGTAFRTSSTAFRIASTAHTSLYRARLSSYSGRQLEQLHMLHNCVGGQGACVQTAEERPPCAAPAAPRHTAQPCWGARPPSPPRSRRPQRHSAARLSAGQSPQPSSSGRPAPARQAPPLQQQSKAAALSMNACRLCADACTTTWRRILTRHVHNCSCCQLQSWCCNSMVPARNMALGTLFCTAISQLPHTLTQPMGQL